MKSRGLEALKYLEDWHDDQFDMCSDLWDAEADIVRKDIEALNIIIKKKVNIDVLSNCTFPCEYNETMENIYDELAENYYLTYQEFGLLKEVLKKERKML